MFKPKIEKPPPLPPMANPPLFASAYSQIAAGQGIRAKAKTKNAAGFEDINATASTGTDLAKPVALATPSLLG